MSNHTLSDFQLSHIIALETVPAHIGRKQVINILGRYGRIIDVQFWTSQNEKKHGFVTFEEPDDASNCLRDRDTFTPRLSVKPLNPTSIRHYRIPHGFLQEAFEMLEPPDESSPSLVSRVSLPSEPTTPPRQPHTQANPYGSVGFTRLNPVASTSTPLAQSWSASNVPSQQAANHQPSNTTSAWLQSLNQAQSMRPSSLPTKASVSVREHDLEEENGRQAAEIRNLKDQLHNLHLSLNQIKQGGDAYLKRAVDDVDRYRAERDNLSVERNNLSVDLKIASEDAKYYRKQLDESTVQCEELKARLIHEGDQHRRQEGNLRTDLRSARDEMFKWKKEYQIAQAELAENRQKLHDSKNAAYRGHYPADGQQTKDAVQHIRKISEPEEGQLSPPQTLTARLPTPANPPPSDIHKQLVIGPLEKAFLRLDEITTDALRKSLKNEEQETIFPNKRQRIGDS